MWGRHRRGGRRGLQPCAGKGTWGRVWGWVTTAHLQLVSSWSLSWQQSRSSSATDLCSALLSAVQWWCATTSLTQRGESSYNVKITLVLSVWAQCFKLCFLLHPSRDSREPSQWQWEFLVLALVLSAPSPDSMGKRQFQPGGHHGIPGYLGLKHKEVSRCQRRC